MPDNAILHNLWTIYTIEETGSIEYLAMCGYRPPDWGTPGKYMYRTVFAGNGAAVHCWHDRQIPDTEFFRLFYPLVMQVYRPGEPEERCRQTHLTDDDVWDDAWGERPPLWQLEEDPDERY
jgi:hypothetical protein